MMFIVIGIVFFIVVGFSLCKLLGWATSDIDWSKVNSKEDEQAGINWDILIKNSKYYADED